MSDQDDESESLQYLGLVLAVRGIKVESVRALDRSLELARQGITYETYDYQTMCALWFEEYSNAQTLANRAMSYAQQRHFEQGMISAARLQGQANLGLGDLERKRGGRVLDRECIKVSFLEFEKKASI